MKINISLTLIFILGFFVTAVLNAADTDLAIVGPLGMSPPNPSLNTEVTLKVFITNNGYSDVLGPVKAEWYIDGKKLKDTIFLNLKIGETKEIDATFKPKSPQHKLKVILVTRLVPYSDTDSSNNIFKADLTFGSTAAQATPQIQDSQKDTSTDLIKQIPGAAAGAGQKGNQPAQIQKKDQGSKDSGSGSSQDSSATSTEESSSSESQSNAASESGASGSGAGSGATDQAATTETGTGGSNASSTQEQSGSAPVFNNSEVSAAFVKYLAAYTRARMTLSKLMNNQEDNDRKQELQVMLFEMKDLNTEIISINNTIARGDSTGMAALETTIDTISSTAAELIDKLEDLDGMDEIAENYNDAMREFLQKALAAVK